MRACLRHRIFSCSKNKLYETIWSQVPNGYILSVKLKELNHFYMDISPLKRWSSLVHTVEGAGCAPVDVYVWASICDLHHYRCLSLLSLSRATWDRLFSNFTLSACSHLAQGEDMSPPNALSQLQILTGSVTLNKSAHTLNPARCLLNLCVY